ncbi:hypothetical protein FOPG_12590 [Fusarium oxysporum f. sp. conglutinans race 2 54008]|uniref:Protein kinase domain-containing protein n=1 Tax=Fusarium oxysporum f. sp. conglutinans race 2 54008 TaxID=1089457 RepID=X0HIR4_FUSOX|nr:hypothetical protein FOPG_12590 [Fusarium oxysporum f. sp. conglutinans race 2 54008]KAG6994770.1 hypothetical protein FocnCong_v017323 [Fusarium oxysporum f. sp. conglutinans]KAI8407602.1 hypothetical protein FOFC_13042 [Fusarium oxysporum]KAJ4024756.1 hypothetical protein NW758_014625 [Fusarium oxysporum]KAJ4078809.1 hypothetical protein NW761_011555 [Fusarium oxysporum]
MRYSYGSPTSKSGNCTDGEVALHAAMHLRFGTRTIQTSGAASDHAHLNVLRLRIHKRCIGGIIESFFRIISKATGSWLQSKFPEWFLPDKIVLKRQKENWEEEFDHEVIAYNRLRPIQGLTIPKLYGKIQYANTRALILSDIGGSGLSIPDGAVLDEQDIEPLLHQALSSLNEYGVCHDDTRLDNFHLVADEGKDKIMIVDLESADFDQTEEELAYMAKNKTKSLLRQYRNHLKCLEHDGVLLPRRPVRR